ncbi:hypothetical protein TWF730_006764 [Orbilia blumenaviensis]|uniref:RRM domain-containing protein n=1 Tax=Orbilia blumenaviensis TaxID=1796055 RepID=A0AAV9VGF5_9PEZI
MREGIVKNFCERVRALEETVGARTAETEKLQKQLREILDVVRGARGGVEDALGQNKLLREKLCRLEDVLRNIERLDISSSEQAITNIQTLTGNPQSSTGTGTKTEVEGRPKSETSGSGRGGVSGDVGLPVLAKASKLRRSTPSDQEDVVELFDFHANDGVVVKDDPDAEKLKDEGQGNSKPGATKAPAEVSDPFAFDDAAVEATYASKANEDLKPELPRSVGSNQTVIRTKPTAAVQQSTEGPVTAPFQRLADLMGENLQGSIPISRDKDATIQESVTAGSQFSTAFTGGLAPASASGVSSADPPMHTARFTTLPPDFRHTGNYPSKAYPCVFYEESQLCGRASYTSEKVPVLRLQNIPKNITLADILESISGGPLYRISVAKGIPGDTLKQVRLTFIHLRHANGFLDFANQNNGIYIRGCPSRIQVIQDPKEKPNVISYTTFRKMMTENVTRMVYIDGFNGGFWTTTKLRDLIVVAVDKLRVEEPDRFQFKEPICDKTDIATVKMGCNPSGKVEALVGLRSIGWAILVRSALHGLQHPEGFYMERVEGEIGPSINPGDDPATIPTLHAWWVPDTIDRPLDRMPKKSGKDAT